MRRGASFVLGIFLTFFAGLTAAHADEPPVLTIYTYESFISEWGPGPALQKAFEAQCGCRIAWVALEDGAAILSRLKLEGKKTKADVVVGLDNDLTAESKATGLFQRHALDLGSLQLPVEWPDDTFMPFDYGYFAFIYDRQSLPHPPRTFAELIDNSPEAKAIVMDPRTSTPGLGLVLWIKALYGDNAPAAIESLSKRIISVTKGWSEGYGLFLKGEAQMVLSYTTSPAYHEMMEKTDRYQAAMFNEGHYLEIEVAARTSTSHQPELARQFLSFLISPEAQSIIPTTNWMYPAIDIGAALPQAFRDLPLPKKTLMLKSEEIAKQRSQWISEWLAAMIH